jgi:nitrite reductase (NADH) small subunit
MSHNAGEHPIERWMAVCRVEDIPKLGSRRLVFGGYGGHGDAARTTAVAVFRAADDLVFALLDRCPHKGGPLSQGIVFGRSVACPLHNWTIGLEDGCAAAPDRGCVPRIGVRLVDGVVHLKTADLDALVAPASQPESALAPAMP